MLLVVRLRKRSRRWWQVARMRVRAHAHTGTHTHKHMHACLHLPVTEAEAAGAEVAQAEQEVAELMASGEVQLKARDDGGLTSRPAGQSRAAAAARFPASFPVDVQEHEAGDMSDREEAEGGAEEDMDEGAIQVRTRITDHGRQGCQLKRLAAGLRS
eukprot:1156900-Pelagomonas_calceolata.AAC.3